MASVSQQIPNFLGGVSKQPDDKKRIGQVREAINSYPDPTFGLTKRPGTKWLWNLSSTTNEYQNGKWFYINRDNAERYIGVIYGSNIKIWNVNNPSATVTVTNNGASYLSYGSSNAKDSLQVLTIQDTTIVCNNTKTITTQAAPSFTPNSKATIRILSAEYGATYSVTIAGHTSSFITRNEDLEPTRFAGYISGTTLTVNSVTNGLLAVGDKINLPGNVQATITALGMGTTGTTGTYTLGSSHTVGSASSDQQFTTVRELLNVDEILTQIKNNIDSLNSTHSLGLTVTKLNSSIELSRSSAFTISVTGGVNGEKLTVIQDEVANISGLPAESVHLRTVKITNNVGKEDAYYAEFLADNNVSGKGKWEETISPGISKGLTASTMPHQLINTGLNTFTFGTVPWEDRLVGDDTTNEHPSFVNNKIRQVFFHANRLGFLTEDNVSMSQSGEYYNFYSTSALTQVASDPIDVSCSSLRPAVLHSVVPVAQGLVLFSRYQQFVLGATDGTISANNAVIRAISNYENEESITPVDVGTNIIFLSKSPGYTRIYAMLTRGQEENPEIADIGRVVSEWVPDTVTDLIASPQNSFLAMFGPTSRYIYFFRTYTMGGETLMQTWFNWKMQGDVNFFVVDSDDGYVVTYASGQYVLSKANLTQSPDDAILSSDSGQVVQLCLDQYAQPSSITYNSTTKVNRCYLKYNDITTLSPAVIIADPNNQGQSGFTVTPTRGSDMTGPYFEFTGDDYSASVSKVYLGLKYDFEVDIPRIYYQIAENRSDYTANLTISRIKFSVGISSNVGFKVKSQGKDEWSDVQSAQQADYYLTDDVPLSQQSVFVLPIHQRNNNFTLKVYSDDPFPISLTSMVWEGVYSPRYYRRA